MSPEDIATLHVGAQVAYRDGSVCVLERRKEDDSGWWVKDQGGLSDRALASHDWSLAPASRPVEETP